MDLECPISEDSRQEFGVTASVPDPLIPEDGNSGDLDLICPVVFPEDDEWRTPPRPQSYTPEYSLSGSPTPESLRSGKRESPFQKWGSPLGTLDSLEFHSGEDPEIVLQTIEEGDESNDSPLNSVSWMDVSHLGWKKVTTVMDSGALDSVAPPSVAPKVATAAA